MGIHITKLTAKLSGGIEKANCKAMSKHGKTGIKLTFWGLLKGYKTRLRAKSLGTPSTTVLRAHAKSPENCCHRRQVPVKRLLPHSPPCTHFPVIPRHKGTADTQQHPVSKNVALHCCILSCSVEKGGGKWKCREKHKIGHFYWVPWDW